MNAYTYDAAETIRRLEDYVSALTADNDRLRTALQTIYTVASADGVAPELDRCFAYAANALFAKEGAR